MAHGVQVDPATCALASIEELAHALLDERERERTLAHGSAAVHELSRRLHARTPAPLTAAGLPPMPWQWLVMPSHSSPVDDREDRLEGHGGDHLVAADGTQLLRCEGGYGVMEIWDVEKRDWALGRTRDQPVAALLAAAPMLLAERNEARQLARELWRAVPDRERQGFAARAG